MHTQALEQSLQEGSEICLSGVLVGFQTAATDHFQVGASVHDPAANQNQPWQVQPLDNCTYLAAWF